MNSPTFIRIDAEAFGYSPGVLATLGLSSIPGIGVSSLRRLGDPSFVTELFAGEDLDVFTSTINALGAKFSPMSSDIADWQSLRERVWRSGRNAAAELMTAGIRCITPSSALYPNRLNDLKDHRPNWLFLKGNLALLTASSVAVVGTRDPSESGDFLTKYAVAALRELNCPVISGLAKGIDSIAHEWSLRLHVPTISILGSGLLAPYPARNADLSERIVAEGGLLISEYLPRQAASSEMFVWRNRLQACLSDCVIATEWKKSSGTAHTIRFARELRRTNISLSLAGTQTSPEQGRAEQHFVLPTEHARFMESISGSVRDELTHLAEPQNDQLNQNTLF